MGLIIFPFLDTFPAGCPLLKFCDYFLDKYQRGGILSNNSLRAKETFRRLNSMKALNWVLCFTGVVFIAGGYFSRADDGGLGTGEDLVFPYFCSITTPGPSGTGCFGQFCWPGTCKLVNPNNGTPITCGCE